MGLGAHDGLDSAAVAGPICAAAAATRRRPFGVSAMRARHVLGDRGVAALQRRAGMARDALPRWNTSMVVSVMRASTTSRIRRDGTE